MNHKIMFGSPKNSKQSVASLANILKIRPYILDPSHMDVTIL